MALWTPEWRSESRLSGERKLLCLWHRHLGFSRPTVFTTRRECREFIEKHYGYIKSRKDLQMEPHGWRMPRPVKVKIVKE